MWMTLGLNRLTNQNHIIRNNHTICRNGDRIGILKLSIGSVVDVNCPICLNKLKPHIRIYQNENSYCTVYKFYGANFKRKTNNKKPILTALVGKGNSAPDTYEVFGIVPRYVIIDNREIEVPSQPEYYKSLYVIVSTGGYWNSTYGWVPDKQSATIFEDCKYTMPNNMDAKWELL